MLARSFLPLGVLLAGCAPAAILALAGWLPGRAPVAPVELRSQAVAADPGAQVTISGGPAARPAGCEAPARLFDTGLYADPAARTLAPGVWPFEPQYPLWTDGASKRRWIRLPAGSSIDASDPDAWVFPVGARLWKEFAFDRPIETRYLEKLADGSWLRASYLWSEDGMEATLAPAQGVRGAAEAAPGVRYDVPGRADCATCHGQGDGVLGFSALQLSADRDPLAPHAGGELPPGQDLAAFVDRGLVRGLPEEHLRAPPRIEARTPRERAALGYLASNCGTCHWGGGLLAGLDLQLDARLGDGGRRALDSLIERPSRFRPAGAPCEVRVRPGAPEESALFHRLTTREPAAQMPPLGTQLVDPEGRDLLEAWIREDLALTTPYATNP